MPSRLRRFRRPMPACACLLPLTCWALPLPTRLPWPGVLLEEARHLPTGVWQALLLITLVVVLSLLWNWRLQVQIRERRAAQSLLQDQLAFQFSLLNGLPTPLYVRDLEGRLTTCNRAYETFFGSTLEALRGTRVQEQALAPAGLAELLEQEHQRLLEHRQPRYFDCCIERDGRPHHVYQWLVPFYSARGRLQGLLGGWIDISERKRLELALREARRQALEASAAKGEFLAAMSHELRTPLNALVGLLELEVTRTPAPSENLRVAQQSANAMMELIGNILDLDKIESGQMHLQPRPTNLVPLLEGSRELFAAQARQRGVALRLRCALPAGRRYRLDPLRLRQVLHNLLGNALKFTPSGHVELAVRARDGGPGLSRLEFRVSDTGIGIPRDVQPHIFEPYRQAHGEISSLGKGSGLGLKICDQLVRLMGGRIHLDSDAGQGCRIGFTLEAEWEQGGVATQALAPSPAPAGEPGAAGLRVLVVDDVPVNGLVLQQQLAALGHDARVLDCGREALEAWKGGAFDVLISDCNMPGLDGYALASAVRAWEREQGRAPATLIGYTASAVAQEAERCQRAGMDDLLIKPVTLAALREVLPAIIPREVAAGFDLGHLERLPGFDAQALERLLDELERTLQAELAALDACPPGDRAESIAQDAHRLSGLACTIDAPELLGACRELERAGDPQALARARSLLRRRLEQLLAGLRRRRGGT